MHDRILLTVSRLIKITLILVGIISSRQCKGKNPSNLLWWGQYYPATKDSIKSKNQRPTASQVHISPWVLSKLWAKASPQPVRVIRHREQRGYFKKVRPFQHLRTSHWCYHTDWLKEKHAFGHINWCRNSVWRKYNIYIYELCLYDI